MHGDEDTCPARRFYKAPLPPETDVGYPSTGGVWVVRFSRDEGWFDGFGRRDGRRRTWAREPEGWRLRMGMVLDMDEKCGVIEMFGGVCYEDVEGAGVGEVLARSLVERRRMFERYGEMLGRMDDGEYVRTWMMGSGGREEHPESEDEYFWDDEAERTGGERGKGCVVL